MKVHRFAFRGTTYTFDPDSVLLPRGDSSGSPFFPPPVSDHGSSPPGLPPRDRVEILVNTTQECNLTCPYCFVHQGRFSYEEERTRTLSPDLVRHLIRVLPEAIPAAREYCIHFYGGEPLMNLEAVDAAVQEARAQKEHRFTFCITTNGTVNTGQALPVLAQGNFSVILSIDGPAPVHDAARRDMNGNPTHAKVLDFLMRLKHEQSLYVRGSSVVRHGWSLRDAEAYLETLPVDAIKAQAVRLPAHHPLGLTPDEKNQYFTHLEEIADAVIGSIEKKILPRDDRFTSRVLQLVCGASRPSFCGAGSSIFGMSCDGSVYPCVLLAGNENLILGHITDPDSGWIKNGQKWLESRKKRAECMDCWALPLCGGGCPAMLSVCGEDECDYTRKMCELSLVIYGSVRHKPDLLVLAGVT